MADAPRIPIEITNAGIFFRLEALLGALANGADSAPTSAVQALIDSGAPEWVRSGTGSVSGGIVLVKRGKPQWWGEVLASLERIDQSGAVYSPEECAVFRRSRDRYGDLSNMTHGFPLEVNGLRFQSPEGLYQALKFPEGPKLQAEIAAQSTGMAAKSLAYRGWRIAPGWDGLRVTAMCYTQAVKLAQHPETFGQALLETEGLQIVDHSTRDSFWGAHYLGDMLVGSNVLGKMLTALREELKQGLHEPASAARRFFNRFGERPLESLVIGERPVPPPGPGPQEEAG